MEKTIFAKKRTNKEGKTFYTYLTKLHKKSTNVDVTVQVKFREDCGAPKGDMCPCNIIFNSEDVNYNEANQTVLDEETGEAVDVVSRVLWVSKWTEGSPYVDDSLNDFE